MSILKNGMDSLNFVQTKFKMKRFKVLLKTGLMIVLIFNFFSSFGQSQTEKKLVIVIDPGHGGKDSGAIGINGAVEKDIVLNIAKYIIELNAEMPNSPLDIYLTRYKDTLISLNDRTKLAKRLDADLFLSLHCNQSDNPKCKRSGGVM